MPEPVRFTVAGDAVSFGTKNTRFRRGGAMITGTRKTNAAADWEASVRRAAAAVMDGRRMFAGPVAVVVGCRFSLTASRYLKKRRRPAAWKTTKPDGDKILRLVLDGMEKTVYPHDAQVCFKTLAKVTREQGLPAETVVWVEELPSVVAGSAVIDVLRRFLEAEGLL